MRTGREMRLTQAGEALVRHAAGIIAGLTAAEEEVAAIAGLRAGRVRLVSFPSGSSTLVPTALAALRAAHPGTRVFLEEAEPPKSVELLREGDCDVALAFRYEGAAGAEEWDDLVVRPLLTDRLVALVPERHRLARTEPGGSVAIGGAGPGPVDRGLPAVPQSVGRGVRRGRLHAPHRLRDRRLSGGRRPGGGRTGCGRAAPARRGVRTAQGVRTVALEPAVRREIVALTLPDLAQVPAVTATLDELARAGARQSATR